MINKGLQASYSACYLPAQALQCLFRKIYDIHRFCAIPYNQYAFHPLKKNTSTETRFFLTLGCLQTGRIQLLLINTIVLHSLCFTFTHRRERTPKQIRVLFV